jgi:20S proteasome alpha/beta subunit
MTTIAYDGKILAADTRYTIKGSFYGYVHKLIPILKGGVIAISGTMGGASLLKAAIEKDGGNLLKSMTKKQIDLLDGVYIDQFGDAFYLDTTAYKFLPIDEPFYASGSGELVAMGFLRAGFSASKAVKAASKVDCHSNDLVDVYDIKKQAFKLVTFPR